MRTHKFIICPGRVWADINLPGGAGGHTSLLICPGRVGADIKFSPGGGVGGHTSLFNVQRGFGRT